MNEKKPENDIEVLLGPEPETETCENNGQLEKQSVSDDKKAREWMRYFGIQKENPVKYNSGFCLFQLISENVKNISHELLDIDNMIKMMNDSSNLYTENELNLVKNVQSIPSVGRAMRLVKDDKKAREMKFLPHTESSYLAYGVYGIRAMRPHGQNYIAIDKRNLRKSNSNWVKYSIFNEKSVLVTENPRSQTPRRVLEFLKSNPLSHCCLKRSFNNLYILNFIEMVKSEDRSTEVNLFCLEPLKYSTFENGSHYCSTGNDEHVVKRPRMQ